MIALSLTLIILGMGCASKKGEDNQWTYDCYEKCPTDDVDSRKECVRDCTIMEYSGTSKTPNRK